VFQILEDARGNFWISCNRGIYRVSKQQLNDFAAGRIQKISSVAYGKQDGMLNFECNGGRQPAGIKTRDGKLWFPTQEGVVVIEPEATPINPLPPPVVIESVALDRAVLPFQNAAAGIEIGPGQANLEINYTGLSYLKSEQMRFRYKLVGQDQDWVDAGTRRAAYYSYLPPGAYAFTVIAANSDGIWNETGASLRVLVTPPFYRTWWFVGLTVLSLAGMIALIYRFRVTQLRKEHAVTEAFSRELLASREAFSRQLLESQESERQRIAAELHDGLGQNLLIIKNHALLGLADREDPAATEENLTMISEMTSQALDEARQIAYNLRPYQIDRFGLTRALQSMLNRVAESSEIGFHCEVDKLDGLFSKEAEMNLYRIVQESINNILKHSRATEAEVRIARNGHHVLLRIADNGQGFDKADSRGRDTLSSANPQSAIRNPQLSGFGLTGMAERARMLGGEYRLQSTPGQGTVISISIALPETTHE
jgi:signal transduction histidine kinase